jgi:hypothetical protein
MSQFNRRELLKSGQDLPLPRREGWLDRTIPRVRIHEAVKVYPA